MDIQKRCNYLLLRFDQTNDTRHFNPTCNSVDSLNLKINCYLIIIFGYIKLRLGLCCFGFTHMPIHTLVSQTEGKYCKLTNLTRQSSQRLITKIIEVSYNIIDFRNYWVCTGSVQNGWEFLVAL